jgi:hypothetical protein
MNLRFRGVFRVQAKGMLLGLAAVAGLASCRHEMVTPVPAVDYFPVAIGSYRTYAVADSTWTNGVVSVSNYQLRERVSEQFTDGAGQLAYRLVRSRRAAAGATWVDDSVLVVQVLPRAVLLTRNNVRTVELVYPLQANKAWNATAFTVNTQTTGVRDSITNLTRAYGPAVGTSFTTLPVGGQAAKSYPATVQTYATLPAQAPATLGTPDVNLYYQRGLQQVYAQGVGLVQRRRFSHYTYTVKPDGSFNLTPGIVQSGISRFETLLETGTI